MGNPKQCADAMKLTWGKDEQGMALIARRLWKKIGLEKGTEEEKAAAKKQWEVGCKEEEEEKPKSSGPLNPKQCADAMKLTKGKDEQGMALIARRLWKKIGLE